eukprot:Hpha_TRINITY_DN26552_c0_g1::TRINITY_DN26552_c0_g1_i1::g.112894::m.112894
MPPKAGKAEKRKAEDEKKGAKKPRVDKKASAVEVPPPPAAVEHSALTKLLHPVSTGLKGSTDSQLSTLKGIAEELLCRWELVIGGVRHRLMEIEAYVHSDAHVDPYTHSDPHQQHSGSWYFHRRGGTYKEASFKGMDLAAGSVADGVFAGLLIRAVKALESDEVTEGPCLVVNRILELTKKKNIAEFVAGRDISELRATDIPELRLMRAAGEAGV